MRETIIARRQVNARLQRGKRDLMRETLDAFFGELFGAPPGLVNALRSQGGVAHPWSNYMIVSPAAMANLVDRPRRGHDQAAPQDAGLAAQA